MKICIYGAGSVGGYIGARLAHAGHEINAVEVGVTLRALQQHGLRLHMNDELLSEKVVATDDPATLGTQDLVIIAVKATVMAQVARKIAPLIGPHTIVMTAMNGVPWWFFDGMDGTYEGMRLTSVDPVREISTAIPSCHVIGCVVHGSFSRIEPGYVKQGAIDRLVIGEPDGTLTERVRLVEAVLSKMGVEIVVSRKIQSDIWFKLWGNMTMNPISALTGATCDRILDDPLVKQFCLKVMAEAARIGAKIGCPIAQSGEERAAVTRKLGAFKTSMLQDAEAGRAIELDALVSAVREIGQKVEETTPNIDILLGLARLYARVHGLYPYDT
jgi:2-dehydropantoate 2-reductase